MSLYVVAFIIFAAIAGGGALMAGLIGTRKPVPAIIPPVHGIGAAIGLAVLLYANLTGNPSDLAWWALGIFTAGGLGGLVLFKVLYKNNTPLPMVFVHGSLGVVGLIVLGQVAFFE